MLMSYACSTVIPSEIESDIIPGNVADVGRASKERMSSSISCHRQWSGDSGHSYFLSKRWQESKKWVVLLNLWYWKQASSV